MNRLPMNLMIGKAAPAPDFMQTQTIEPTVKTSAPKPSAVKRVTFGKAAKKEETTSTKYPVFNDPAIGSQVSDIAARIRQRATELESLEGAQKTDKAEIKMLVGPFYFRENQNKSKPPSSISIPTVDAEGRPAAEVLVTFQNRYSKLDDEGPLNAIMGEENAAKYIRQSFELKINGEDLPSGKEQEIVDAVIALLDEHNAGSALEVKESLKPSPTFHIERLSVFTPEQNLQIEQAWPVVSMVKTKGRGE